MGHVLMENRNGLAVGASVTEAGYHAEHTAAIGMVKGLKGNRRRTVGGDKHYDDFEFCRELRKQNVTPHVAQNLHAKRHHSAVDARTTRHTGYEISGTFGVAVYNLLRISNLLQLKTR